MLVFYDILFNQEGSHRRKALSRSDRVTLDSPADSVVASKACI